MGIIARTVRALVAEILSQEFIVGLRAKGLDHLGVFRHVVKNAAPTALAVMGIQLGYLLGGSILIETVFSWPGTGFLLNAAIFQRDLPLLQGTILVLALFFVVLNLAVDVVQTALDPRIADGAEPHADAPARPPMLALASHPLAGLLGDGVAPLPCAIPWPWAQRVVILAIILVAHLRALHRAAGPLPGHDLAPPQARPASEGFPLGTDELGRDMLSRLIWGARLSLFMGVTPVMLALVIGSTIGIVAGYVGGWLNTILMRTIDVFFAFPSVLLAIALSGALGAGILNALISLTVVFIPPIARVAESVTTSVRTRDYVEAARASGAGALHHHPRAGAGQRDGPDLRLRA